MTKRAEKGLHNVTVAMYGYERDEEGNLHIVENEAKWVKWIFDQYIQGKGSSTLAKELNNMGIRRNQGAMWDQHKVMLTLKNLHYAGKVHWKSAKLSEDSRIIREGIHEPIISMETYEKAQHILSRRKEGKISQNSYDYVFGGILKCGKCGGSYKGKYNKRKLLNGDPALYRGYVCSNNERYGNCDQSGISEKNMSKLLFDNIELMKLQKFKPEQPEDDARKEIESMMKQSELKRARWQHAYGEGLMSYEDFASRMKEEQTTMAEWGEKLEELIPEQAPSISPEQAVKSLKMIFKRWDNIEQTEKKQLIQSLFQRITISKEGKWVITDILTI
jgi:site-specific DNA recombinase